MVGMNKVFRSARIATAGLALSLLLTTCEPLALRDLAEKLAQGGAKHLYITDRDASKIYRCELDGSNLVEIEQLSGRGNPAMIAVDPAESRLFWTSIPLAIPPGKVEVISARFDGSDIRVHFQESDPVAIVPRGLSPKSSANALFWAGHQNNTIYRQNYSPSAPSALTMDPAITDTYDIAYCPILDRLFVADRDSGRIFRIQVDGTLDATLLLSDGFSMPFNLTVDSQNAQVYWSDDDGSELSSNGTIYRCKADDFLADIETVVSSAGSLRQLVVSSEEGFIFWADDTSNSIKRANLDGTGIRTIVSGLQNPRGVALDPVRR